MIWVEAKGRRQVAHVSNHSSGDTRQSGAMCHLLNDQLIIINVPQWSKVRDYLSHLADAHRLLVSNDEIKSLFNHPAGSRGAYFPLHPSILPSNKATFSRSLSDLPSLSREGKRGKEVRFMSAALAALKPAARFS